MAPTLSMHSYKTLNFSLEGEGHIFRVHLPVVFIDLSTSVSCIRAANICMPFVCMFSSFAMCCFTGMGSQGSQGKQTPQCRHIALPASEGYMHRQYANMRCWAGSMQGMRQYTCASVWECHIPRS